MDEIDSLELTLAQIKKKWLLLVAENTALKQSITSIFNEEEIKACSSYDLMKATYTINDKSVAEQHKESTKFELHSIYEPRSSHQIKKPQITVAKTKAKVNVNVSEKKPISIKPTMDSDNERAQVLEEINADVMPCTTDVMPCTTDVMPCTTDVMPCTTDVMPKPVIKVVIDDISYYFYHNKFYALDGVFAGKLENGIIMISGKPYTLQEKKLIKCVGSEHFRDKDDFVYTACDEYTSRIIGEYNNDEINLYQ